ncbi:MAG: hypothetical protein AB7G28_19695 [Pirellulales bacterium]
MADNNKPVHQVRLGRIKAAIFENGDNAPRKVTFTALYKDDEDQWKGSQSFTREDLPLLIKVADQVHSYLYEQSGQNGSSGAF